MGSFLFWGSLAFALAVAFVVAFPVNRYLISRGKGHAVVYEYHGGTGTTAIEMRQREDRDGVLRPGLLFASSRERGPTTLFPRSPRR